MSAISSIVKRRVSSTFCTEPADTATPHIAGAMAGSGTSKIKDHHRAGTVAGPAIHGDELPTRSFEQLLHCRSPIGVGVLPHRIQGLRRVVRCQTEQHQRYSLFCRVMAIRPHTAESLDWSAGKCEPVHTSQKIYESH